MADRLVVVASQYKGSGQQRPVECLIARRPGSVVENRVVKLRRPVRGAKPCSRRRLVAGDLRMADELRPRRVCLVGPAVQFTARGCDG